MPGSEFLELPGPFPPPVAVAMVRAWSTCSSGCPPAPVPAVFIIIRRVLKMGKSWALREAQDACCQGDLTGAVSLGVQRPVGGVTPSERVY